MPEWGIRVATAVHGVFSERYPATRGQGLAASRWAPKPAPLELGGAGKVSYFCLFPVYFLFVVFVWILTLYMLLTCCLFVVVVHSSQSFAMNRV